MIEIQFATTRGEALVITRWLESDAVKAAREQFWSQWAQASFVEQLFQSGIVDADWSQP